MEQSHLERALEDCHLRIDKGGKIEKIVYVALNHFEGWSDPEEKVRAEFYAELIYRYGCSPDRIGVEITVPDRSPNDYADLVVFEHTKARTVRRYAVCHSSPSPGKWSELVLFNESLAEGMVFILARF
jgi:type I restriction enzyme M protein